MLNQNDDKIVKVPIVYSIRPEDLNTSQMKPSKVIREVRLFSDSGWSNSPFSMIADIFFTHKIPGYYINHVVGSVDNGITQLQFYWKRF